MNVTEQLRAAKAKILDPERWCKGSAARDCLGLGVWPDSPLAVSWCQFGAVYCIAGLDGLRPFLQQALQQAAKQLGYTDPVDLNDSGTHGLVMAMFDSAIELSEKETQCR